MPFLLAGSRAARWPGGRLSASKPWRSWASRTAYRLRSVGPLCAFRHHDAITSAGVFAARRPSAGRVEKHLTCTFTGRALSDRPVMPPKYLPVLRRQCRSGISHRKTTKNRPPNSPLGRKKLETWKPWEVWQAGQCGHRRPVGRLRPGEWLARDRAGRGRGDHDPTGYSAAERPPVLRGDHSHRRLTGRGAPGPASGRPARGPPRRGLSPLRCAYRPRGLHRDQPARAVRPPGRSGRGDYVLRAGTRAVESSGRGGGSRAQAG